MRFKATILIGKATLRLEMESPPLSDVERAVYAEALWEWIDANAVDVQSMDGETVRIPLPTPPAIN